MKNLHLYRSFVILFDLFNAFIYPGLIFGFRFNPGDGSLDMDIDN